MRVLTLSEHEIRFPSFLLLLIVHPTAAACCGSNEKYCNMQPVSVIEWRTVCFCLGLVLLCLCFFFVVLFLPFSPCLLWVVVFVVVVFVLPFEPQRSCFFCTNAPFATEMNILRLVSERLPRLALALPKTPKAGKK